ncbi:MAG: 50S ribosomal protein L10 [bacterium]
MATKAFKNEKLEEIKEAVANAKVAIVTDFRGYTVAEITALRRELQKDGAEYTVVKNTLAKIAVQGTPYEPLAEILKGPVAVAFGFKDQVAPAKVLTQYIKKAKKGQIIGGVLDGNLLNAKDVANLATIPSREELYSKMLGSINSPATGIVMCVSGVMSALTRAVDEVRKQKEA